MMDETVFKAVQALWGEDARRARGCTCGGTDIGVGTMHEPHCGDLGPEDVVKVVIDILHGDFGTRDLEGVAMDNPRSAAITVHEIRHAATVIDASFKRVLASLPPDADVAVHTERVRQGLNQLFLLADLQWKSEPTERALIAETEALLDKYSGKQSGFYEEAAPVLRKWIEIIRP